ncbi:MipA/OmpV family protein [Ensifer canadensis]
MPRMYTRDTISRVAATSAVLFVIVSSETFAADAVVERPMETTFDDTRFEPAPEWGLSIGAGGLYAPEYEGSADFKVSPIPMISVTYGNWLTVDPRGLSVTAFEKNGFSLAGRAGYEVGRDEDDSDRLEGLGDIGFAATVGATAAYSWEAFEIYAEIDQTIDGSEGLVGKIGVEYSGQVNDKIVVSAGVSGTLANEKHMQSYFGVTGAQSAASGLPEHKAEAGLKRADLTVSATYIADDNWFARGEAGLGVLMGDAADSPIVEREIQPSIMAIVGYKF